ncbi:MAG TPA: PAS domain S-box protein, partial [Chryseosolibacter sp.]|nr:PAS domain S-box protein [Chryseosolibacter sp.]
MKGIKISTKITLLILLLAVIAVTVISFFTHDYIVKLNQEKFTTTLNVVADNKAAYTNHYFGKISASIQMVAASETVVNGGESTAAPALDEFGMPLDSVVEVVQTVSLPDYLSQQLQVHGFEDLLVINPSGYILASGSGKSGNFLDQDGSMFEQGQRGVYFSMMREDTTGYHSYVIAPITGATETQMIVGKIKLNEVIDVVADHKGLGETGEVILAQFNPLSNTITYISPLRTDATLSPYNFDDNVVRNVRNTIEGHPTIAEGTDYKGDNVLEVVRKVDLANLAVIAKVDLEEANGNTAELIKTQALAGLAVVAIATLLSMIFSRALTRPLYAMRNKLGLVAQGILPEANVTHNSDEFGQMGTKVDELVNTLKGNADFAQRVGEGKYDTQFTPASENDVLGMSLLNMRKNLVENERRDKERNWIVRGVAEISEILRMHDSIDNLGEDVIKFIIGKIDAIQGAFYVVNDDESNNRIIEMRASWAYNRRKYLKAKFKFAEGLVGQAAAEHDTVLRTEIPDDYVTITSGILGDQRPRCVLIVPLITNDEVYGVLEFAGFRKFDQSQVNFVKELSLILARTIFNIKVNERTRRLLAESQEMSNELKEKQEVLRQNAEEMQATQEELKRSNQMLEDQIEEVNRTQKRMQLLLENASEVITIYEEDESIRYISPSVETILGYGQKEMIGKSDIDKVHPDHRETFREIFRRMHESPDAKITMQYEYKSKEGGYIWIESTGTNCMSNPAIHGYILNSRDITERRRAELEQRMRSKMQALSENSPDLITRLEDGSISYINPVIESYTGKGPRDFLNKKADETHLDPKVLESWLRIVEEVNSTNDKVATEMDFPSEMGKRVMQVNAIPEYDESSKIESVLVVSHDITDRKLIELEIQNKNKKITES